MIGMGLGKVNICNILWFKVILSYPRAQMDEKISRYAHFKLTIFSLSIHTHPHFHVQNIGTHARSYSHILDFSCQKLKSMWPRRVLFTPTSIFMCKNEESCEQPACTHLHFQVWILGIMLPTCSHPCPFLGLKSGTHVRIL